MLKKKLRTIQSLLRAQHLDGLIIGNFGHQIHDDLLYYFLLQHLELGLMYIPAKGRASLYGISFEVAELKAKHREITVRSYDGAMGHLLQRHIQRKQTIGYRPSALPSIISNQLKHISLATLKKFTAEYEGMAIKNGDEVNRIKTACVLTNQIFSSLVNHWNIFKTETDVSQFICLEIARLGVEPSFPPIVASGAHASNPHHQPTAHKLGKGFCVIDMGVRYYGYCSDMTRTIFIGTPTKKERALYEKLLSVQTETIQMVAPMSHTADIDEHCRTSLGKKLNKQFVHGLGHGLGTQVHEWPSVSVRQDVELLPGMVITIEPGVYLSGKYGIRIEDDILVTNDGHDVLTQTTKDLLLV